MSESAADRDIDGVVARLLDEAKELQDLAASHVSRTSREEDTLRQRAASLDSHISSLRSSLRSSSHADKLADDLIRTRHLLSEGDAAAYFPSKFPGGCLKLLLWNVYLFECTNLMFICNYMDVGRFLRMFLGPINVRANRKDVQLKVKEEYNNFRDRTSYLFLCLPSLLLMLRSWIWDGCLPALPVQIYQAWLLYLYTSLALRENILRVNGSDIRPWWIKHHYYAMAMALISLTWEIERGPDCAQKQRGVQLFLKWAIMQGFSMILQNRYQRQRLYTRIALGKARRMDVVWGETAGVDGQLLLLFPILFILQGFEAYVGVLLLKIAFGGVTSEWQVITSGILLIIMAVGNFGNTVQTLVKKSRVKAKMKKGRSGQDLKDGSHDKISD